MTISRSRKSIICVIVFALIGVVAFVALLVLGANSTESGYQAQAGTDGIAVMEHVQQFSPAYTILNALVVGGFALAAMFSIVALVQFRRGV